MKRLIISLTPELPSIRDVDGAISGIDAGFVVMHMPDVGSGSYPWYQVTSLDELEKLVKHLRVELA